MENRSEIRGPRYPAWLQDHFRAQRDFIEGLRPFPFEQPSDISNYLSLHQNDYLRLANHPDVRRARGEANGTARVESFSSSVFGGASREHDRFVARLTESLQADDVLLTTAGWTANVGLLDSIADDKTPVYIDMEAHASLVDGVRLAGAPHVAVRHNDPAHLAKRLKVHGRGVVCIDALYSTDGTLPPLADYVDICERHDCILVLDEAHSFGMFGLRGGGLAVHLGLADRVHFRTVSLSKALGGHGGLVCGSHDFMRSLRTRMRPVLFSSATSAVLAAGHCSALEIVMREPQRAAHCLEMGALLARRLEAGGIDTKGSRSQIVSVFFNGEEGACQLYGALRDKGILSSVFIYPATPKGVSLVRFSVYSELTPAQIGYVADCTIESVDRTRMLR